jgi:hypothetical protein
MHKQGKELVQGDPVEPPISQRRRLVIGGNDPLEVRTPEEPQHREVGLPMPTMRSGVDEPHPVATPEHGPAPEVAMQPGRRLGRPSKLPNPVTDGLDGPRLENRPAVDSDPQIRKHPILGIPLSPTMPGDIPHGRKPDPGINRPTGRRDPKRIGPGQMKPRKLPPKILGRTGRRTSTRHNLNNKPLIIKRENSRHPRPANPTSPKTVGTPR